jgi:Aminoglycoside-2''-adenylyltransferase
MSAIGQALPKRNEPHLADREVMPSPVVTRIWERYSDRMRRPIDDVQYARARTARHALLDVLSTQTPAIVTHVGPTSWPIDSWVASETRTTDFVGDLSAAANATIDLFVAVADLEIGRQAVEGFSFDDLVTCEVNPLGHLRFHEVVSERSYRRTFPDVPVEQESIEHWNANFGPVHNLQALFQEAAFPWCLGGGWALDLFAGSVTRAHEDLDVVFFRNDAAALQTYLIARGWDVELIENHQYCDWPIDTPLPDNVTQLHLDHPGNDIGHVDVLLTPSTTNGATTDWVFRRDERITRNLNDAIVDGVLSPELVLLFKLNVDQTNVRQKDEADFQRIAPALSTSQRDWLRGAITLIAPSHPWLVVLA